MPSVWQTIRAATGVLKFWPSTVGYCWGAGSLQLPAVPVTLNWRPLRPSPSTPRLPRQGSLAILPKVTGQNQRPNSASQRARCQPKVRRHNHRLSWLTMRIRSLKYFQSRWNTRHQATPWPKVQCSLNSCLSQRLFRR